MRIDSSVIGMESERTYSSVSGRVSKFTITEGRADLAEGTGNLFGNLLQPEEGDPEQAKEKETSEDFITKTMEEMRAKQARRTGSIKTPEMEETRRQLYSIRQQCLNFLMNLLFPDRMGLRDETDEEVSQGTDSGESSLQSVWTGCCQQAHHTSELLRLPDSTTMKKRKKRLILHREP